MKTAALSILIIIMVLACGDSAVSVFENEKDISGHSRDEEAMICHENMRVLANACSMFYGMHNRYPEALRELEDIDPGLCTLSCPSCELPYLYEMDPQEDDYVITCPDPVDPNHGYVKNGVFNWPPDPPGWPSYCHGNMMSLATGLSMYFGINNFYPEDLRELGIAGIMDDWDRRCPACGELYDYNRDGSGENYELNCPMPADPNHGQVINGEASWPPDTSGFTDACRSNLCCLATGMSMFYGMFNRYPDELRELGEEGIMGNWYVPCPGCGEIYDYFTDSTGQTYSIICPMPGLLKHGSIVDGMSSWD